MPPSEPVQTDLLLRFHVANQPGPHKILEPDVVRHDAHKDGAAAASGCREVALELGV